MERWVTIVAEPTLLLGMVVAAAVPLLLLPGPIGVLLSLLVVSSGVWLDHRLGESVRNLPVRVGPESMRGQSAVVVEPLAPAGVVRCGGELWRAVEVCGLQVTRGEKVRVVRVRGLELQVVSPERGRAQG